MFVLRYLYSAFSGKSYFYSKYFYPVIPTHKINTFIYVSCKVVAHSSMPEANI